MRKTNRLMAFILLLASYEAVVYLSNDMYLPALPQMMHDLSIGDHLAQLTLTSWFLGASTLQLVLGPISDRFGRRPVLLMGGILFVLASILTATGTGLYSLFIGRFVQGMAVCSVIVAGYASVHELFDQRKAIQMLAIMSAITILAPAFGPVVGGVIVNYASWRVIFWIFAIWAAVALTALYIAMPESNPPENRKPLELRPLFTSYKKIFFNRHFWGYNLAYCFMFCGFIAWLVAGPFIVSNLFGMNEVMFGVAQFIIFGFYTISTRIVKRIIDTVDIRKLLQTGLGVVALGSMAVITTAILLPNHLWPTVAALALYGAGSGLVFSPLQRLSIDTSEEPMGARMAVFSTTMSISAVMSSILVSAFYHNSLLSFARIPAILGVLSLLSYLYFQKVNGACKALNKTREV